MTAPGPVPPRWARAVLMVLMLAGWFWTQALIGSRGFPEGAMGDAVHTWTASWHAWLWQNEGAADALLIASSLFIDAFGVFLLGAAIFGPTFRPLLGLFMLFGLRQICQLTCALPPPDQMIWRDPGFPSLLVTYGVSNDLFFSGHTAIAVYGAVELARLGQRWLKVLAVLVAVFEATTVIVLRAHYTLDVFTGAVTALLIAVVALRVAPSVDSALARLSRRAAVEPAAGTS
jgi:membrane-associated phospholipid phosphatase